MLRINKESESEIAVTLRLEGRIVSRWVDELETVCRLALTKHRHVRLDFSGVKYVDPRGVQMLRRLGPPNITFVNCPTLVDELLDSLSRE